MSMYGFVPNNSELEIEEETDIVLNPSDNRILSERQFRRAWMQVGKKT
jgi:hypothetical protein